MTLRDLTTISELFEGFNLISTCLIMCQNARKMHHSETENLKIFKGGVLTPS